MKKSHRQESIMPHTVLYSSEDQIIYLTIKEILDWPTLRAAIHSTAEIVKRENCFDILTDLREARVELRLFEMYDFPDEIYKISKEVEVNLYSLKRVFIIASKIPMMKFYETVAVNRGHTTKLFLDYDEAREWLKNKKVATVS